MSSNATPPSKSDAAASNFRSSVPWQVDWKNPTWSKYSTPTTDSVSESSSVKRKTIVGISTAQVLASEIAEECHSVWRSSSLTGKSLDAKDDENFLLTITLLDPSGKSWERTESPVATELVLELSHYETEQILLSRTLVWPETIGSATRQRKQTQRRTIWTDVGEIFLPWLELDAEEETAENACLPAAPSDSGLVAATLCRQPKTPEAQREEALEVISSMMVGLDPSRGGTEEVIDEEGRNKRFDSSPKNEDSIEEEAGEAESTQGAVDSPLCLACVTAHGLICIYSVWDLLSLVAPMLEDSENASSKSLGLAEEKAMAAWLFGDKLFQQLETTWLPLSRPKTTISLSILNEDWNQQKLVQKAVPTGSDEDGDKARIAGPATDSELLDTNLPPLPRPSPSLLAWNPWIEASTLAQRTVRNRATSIHVVDPAFPYLVTLGQGLPHDSIFVSSQSRKKKLGSLKTEIGGKEATLPATTPLETARDGTDKDWWVDSKQSNPSTTKKEQQDGNRDKKWWAGDADAASENETKKPPGKITPKTNATRKGSNYELPPAHMGGCVTFCSMVSWAEYKTFFLDFVPRYVTHVEHWRGMELLLCIGDEKVVAIRLDSAAQPVMVGLEDEVWTNMATIDPNNSGSGHHFSHIPTLTIPRFQILPVEIQLPVRTSAEAKVTSAEAKVDQRILCAGTALPSLLQLYTEYDLNSQEERGLLVMSSFSGLSAKGSIATSTPEADCVAQIPAQKLEDGATPSLLRSAWGCLGQGWSLLGTHSHIFFLCWEGATINSGVSFLRELPSSPNDSLSARCVTSVLPLPGAKRKRSRALEASLRLPFSEPYEDIALNQLTDDEPGSLDLVAEAMQSISTFHMDGGSATLANSLSQEELKESSQLSHQQKSVRLLRHLSSWTQLENTTDNREWLERRVPIIAIKSGGGDSSISLSILNMRQVVVENGIASPFSQVLGWLSQKQDYFTAASIALDLLRDPETLYHLWKNAEKIDEEDEQTKLSGLLDGIVPINVEGDPHSAQPSKPAAWTQLADMTVGCLVKGGLAMSKTLIRFLHTNQFYDPARASLMLVAATANTVSGDEGAVASAMGSPLASAESIDEYTITDLLWPMQCLLEIGVARDFLKMALNLLNAAIPDELRRRPREGGNMSLPPLELTKAVVTMIVSCDRSGAQLLLDLPTEHSSSSYWDSLDGETQQALALTEIRKKYPMLYQEEVREWTRRLLHLLLKGDGNDTTSFITIEWLRDLVVACLFNAGCDLQDFVLNPTNMSMVSVGSENSSDWADLEMDGEDGLYQHKLEVVETRNALEPAPGSGGLDFDLLISSLLLLRSFQESWHDGEERFVSTQSLLDAASYLAGRPSLGTEVPQFGLDAKTLMQQCALSGNVRAGANLIGGKDGFVLSCCDIMMLELQVSMEDAEAFFLNDMLDIQRIITTESSKFQQETFELTDSHRQLLWLLDEHVLRIRTYGEFEAEQFARGSVDPVFAARSVFRGWLCLTHACKKRGSEWICRWLGSRLGLQNSTTSRHRLVCAALVRALIWPSDGNESDEESMAPDSLLGHVLAMDKHFLIKLAQSSCGLVESIPPATAEALIGLTDATQELSAGLASVRIPRAV